MDKRQLRPYLVRLLVASLVSLVFVFGFNEISYQVQKESHDRQPATFEIVIPPGTAEKVAAGKEIPSLIQERVFVIGDVIRLVNEDSVAHQLGPLWAPPGASAQLGLTEPNKYAYTCSFTPSRYLGFDVRAPTTISTRLTGMLLAAPTMTVFLFIYSLLVFPLRTPGEHKLAEGSS